MPAEVFEVVDWIINAFGGWRYVVSPSFRRRTHDRWKVEGKIQATIEILLASFGLLLTIILAVVLVGLLWL